MLERLINICILKVGSKRKLGIKLGYTVKYAGQSVDKLLDHQNPKWEVVQQLIDISGIHQEIDSVINLNEIKINNKKINN